MAGVPQHAPLAGFARAVQAYSYARIQGYTLEQAEHAALAAYPALRHPGATEWTMVDVARASRGARQAAAALGDPAAPMPPEGLPNAARSYGLGAGGASMTGATVRTVTAAVAYTPGTGLHGEPGGPVHYITVQIDAPVGMPFAAIRQALLDAATEAVEGPEADYPGSIQGVEVQTVIGQ